jgi:hypothetical protein
VRRAKPESVAAAEAVHDALTVTWIDGTFSPYLKSEDIQNLKDRLSYESYSSQNGRPSVVFYTAYGAAGPSRSGKTVELRSSELSAKVEPSIFDVVKSRQSCIYAMYVNLIKVNISGVTPEHDTFLTNRTGPFMAFFEIDGTCKGVLSGSMINASSFNRAVSTLLGNPAGARQRLGTVAKKLSELEKMSRDLFLMEEKLKKSQAEAARMAKKKKGSLGKQISSGATSVAEKRLTQLQQTKTDLDRNILECRSGIHELTGKAVGCEGCPVCVQKAKAAAAAAAGQATSSQDY